jgi:hypothetical protein
MKGEVLNFEGLGIASLDGLDSFPNLREVYSANNLLIDLTGVATWLASPGKAGIVLDNPFNTLPNDATLCTSLAEIQTSINNLGGTFSFNPQGNDGGFNLSLERWGRTGNDTTVLDLVTAINSGNADTATYEICGD